MFDTPDSPALTSVLSLALGVAGAVLAGLYFSEAIQAGRGAALVACLALAFSAVMLGMSSISTPGPGLAYALLGVGIGMAVIVLGFLTFLLNLTRS